MKKQNNISPTLGHLSTCYTPEGEVMHTAFSKSPCECCGSHLAGERYTVEAVDKEGVVPATFEVCPDCVCDFQ